MKLEQLHEDYSGIKLPEDLGELANQFEELYGRDGWCFVSTESFNMPKPMADGTEDWKQSRNVKHYFMNFKSEERARQFKVLVGKKLPNYAIGEYKDQSVVNIFKVPRGWDKSLIKT